MPAQTKPKVKTNAPTTNRGNGKASKKNPGRKHHRVVQTELAKALMGGGAMKRIERPAPGNEPVKAAA